MLSPEELLAAGLKSYSGAKAQNATPAAPVAASRLLRKLPANTRDQAAEDDTGALIPATHLAAVFGK